ncbi:hypothetical protein ACE04B_34050 [Rhizobium phaseoli]
MTRITRRRLLGGAAAASLPVALPEAAAGMDDLGIVRMLIDAHRDALHHWKTDLPEEIFPDDEAVNDALSGEKDRTAEALCFYRPTTIEGVHAKAEYMFGCADFVDQEANDDWTRAELISGFLSPMAASEG